MWDEFTIIYISPFMENENLKSFCSIRSTRNLPLKNTRIIRSVQLTIKNSGLLQYYKSGSV